MNAIPFLTGPDLAALATEADAVGFLEEALSSGRVDPEDDSPRLFSPAPGGEFLIMPTGGPTWSGVKVVTVAPGNPARGKPKIQGVYALVASEDLAPTVLMDAVELTLLRTPATTVLAIRHLLAAGAERGPGRLPVVVFGTGPQTERHLRCLAAVVGPIDAVVVGRRTAGNLLGARRVDEWADLPVANLADLVAGRFERRPGRPAVFSGVGMSWEDLAVATALYERHLQQGEAAAATVTSAETQPATGARL